MNIRKFFSKGSYRQLIYPGIFMLIALGALFAFIDTARFITNEMNRVFFSETTAAGILVDTAQYDIIAKKLGLPTLSSEASEETQQPIVEAATTTQEILVDATPEELDPAKLTIEVYNATSVSGLAGKIRDKLTKEGFTVSKVGNKISSGKDTIQIKESKQAYLSLVLETLGSGFAEAEVEVLNDDASADCIVIAGKP